MMKHAMRLAVFAAVICLGGLTLPHAAEARTKHHSRHVIHHKKTQTHGDAQLRDAQRRLATLGYYTGTPDGIYGPKTGAAIKSFQRDHYLRATGLLSHDTYKAIVAADNATGISPEALKAPAYQPPNFYAAHPDPYGYVNPQYSNPMQNAPQVIGAEGTSRSTTLPTRYGRVEMSESGDSNGKRYTVTLDGQPVMEADGQPSVIGVSRTYQAGGDDIIILSAYRDSDPVCAYNTYLFVVNGGGHAVKNVGSCSRGYQAETKRDALYITFPQTDSNSAVGATYRYEAGRMFKL